jgi:FKBP-type peptidyl-prolyl cis-trans isomerase
MKQFIYLSAICILALTACTGSFKKGDKGLEYKLISSGSGKEISYGNFMQIHIKIVYAGTKDTVLMDTRDEMPQMQPLDSVSMPLAYFKILKQMKKGDSLVIRTLTDSLFKDPQNPMPPYMQKGKYRLTTVKLVNYFQTKEQADSAYQAEVALAKPKFYKKNMELVEKELANKKAQLDADSKIIEAYLLKNNITAQKTKWGTYITIVTEGVGEKLNNSNVAVVNYTGRTLDSGKVFDSNIDPMFKHVEPLYVNLSELGGIILGWTDALLNLKKGSKAVIYVPSTLGYAEAGKDNKIKPNDNLIFEMEVTDVTTEAAAMARQKAMQEEMIKKMQESQNQGQTPDTKNPGNK